MNMDYVPTFKPLLATILHFVPHIFSIRIKIPSLKIKNFLLTRKLK